ncbi:hypothetical protein AUK40_02725 [Candidatus Wirthbacteria bacterium CG2_30_54_11]|uniref:Phage holin family protein n=1 Tax=Candidatus Wirthbacteria bacterium CG2_30_54_11 TaxID=1817892 RepID=A0A1J5J2B3_9BACT|nr:MAG: hypothetical protein AUK40_02725 [Candidatus Wirthbacteria bacterium CG2_30_54_11]
MLLNIIVNTIAVYVAAQVVPGVSIDSFLTALVVAVILGILNTFMKPILILLTLPITVFTLGLFLLVINTVMILIASNLVHGFSVTGNWSALLLGVVIWAVNSFLQRLK